VVVEVRNSPHELGVCASVVAAACNWHPRGVGDDLEEMVVLDEQGSSGEDWGIPSMCRDPVT